MTRTSARRAAARRDTWGGLDVGEGPQRVRRTTSRRSLCECEARPRAAPCLPSPGRTAATVAVPASRRHWFRCAALRPSARPSRRRRGTLPKPAARPLPCSALLLLLPPPFRRARPWPDARAPSACSHNEPRPAPSARRARAGQTGRLLVRRGAPSAMRLGHGSCGVAQRRPSAAAAQGGGGGMRRGKWKCSWEMLNKKKKKAPVTASLAAGSRGRHSSPSFFRPTPRAATAFSAPPRAATASSTSARLGAGPRAHGLRERPACSAPLAKAHPRPATRPPDMTLITSNRRQRVFAISRQQ